MKELMCYIRKYLLNAKQNSIEETKEKRYKISREQRVKW